MQTCQNSDPKQARINGSNGEMLALHARHTENWGDERFTCLLQKPWIRAEVSVLSSRERIKNFFNQLCSFEGNRESKASFINEDGNCEIEFISKPFGKAEVLILLLPNMIESDKVNATFEVLLDDIQSFAFQIKNQFEL